ncbi:MAG: ECF-type sigma factor [Planctomycetota bacterium]
MDDHPITRALQRAALREPDAQEALWALVYEDLRGIAAARLRMLQPGQTLQATALVHEAWLRLNQHGALDWQDRQHFYSAAARSMRNILVDHARTAQRQKRGGGRPREALPDNLIAEAALSGVDLIALDEALDALAAEFERPARILNLRFFAGMDIDEIATMFDVTPRTVERDLRFARTWLRCHLDRE